MHKYKIDIATFKDVTEFVRTITYEPGEIKLTDETGNSIDAKSLLGTIVTLGWKHLYCISDRDIKDKIDKFVICEVAYD